jgi:hypothetical protein
MALIKKDAVQLQAQEHEIHQALKAWYLTPGLQRDLRNKENEAVQTVLAVLERRRTAAQETANADQPSAARKSR